MLLNLSNHPLSQWTEKQKETAKTLFGEVVDLPFPFVEPELTTVEVIKQASDYFDQVISLFGKARNKTAQNAVHIQGEFTFVFHLVTQLKQAGIKCLASTSKRDVQQIDNKKIINFNFIQFREY